VISYCFNCICTFQVEDLSKEPHVECELMLLKLNANTNTYAEVVNFHYSNHSFENCPCFICLPPLSLCSLDFRTWCRKQGKPLLVVVGNTEIMDNG